MRNGNFLKRRDSEISVNEFVLTKDLVYFFLIDDSPLTTLVTLQLVVAK